MYDYATGCMTLVLSHRMYSLISSKKSTPPQIINLNGLLLLIKMSSWQFCWDFDFLKLMNRCIVLDKASDERGEVRHGCWPHRNRAAHMRGTHFNYIHALPLHSRYTNYTERGWNRIDDSIFARAQPLSWSPPACQGDSYAPTSHPDLM